MGGFMVTDSGSCYHIAVALNKYHGKRVLVIDGDYQRGGVTGRFFPALIESFGTGVVSGISLFHKFQQLYSATPQTPEVDILRWQVGVDVLSADPRLSTVSVDKLPSSNNIRANNLAILNHLRTISHILTPLQANYDYVLIDSHPEVSAMMRAIIYASDYCVSPVKLDRQSSIGVATVIGEIRSVNADIEMVRSSLKVDDGYSPTVFAGAIGMMAREWGGDLKQTEQSEYSRLKNAGGAVFDTYVTEGDGLRQAAARRVPVFDVQGANAQKQSDQFRELTIEFLRRCP